MVANAKTTTANAPADRMRRVRPELETARVAAENEEETDEERDTDMPGDQVHPTGASHLGLVVLERYEHVGGERHNLPGHEEDHGSPGDQDEHHRRQQHVEKERRRARGAPGPVRPHIEEAVDAAERAHDQKRHQEEAGERIEPDFDGARRELPRNRDGDGRPPAQ